MTKGEAKAAALRWLDEATVGGREADSDELADYKNRMDTLLDSAVQQLATQFPLCAVWESEGSSEITLPEDFYELETVLSQTQQGIWCEFSGMQRVGQKTFLLEQGAGLLRFYYHRLPQHIAPDDEDSTVLDLAPGTEDLLALRLAADVTAGTEEKSGVSTMLDARFQNAALNRMTQWQNHRTRIETRYGGLL